MVSVLACERRVGALSLPVAAGRDGSVSRLDARAPFGFPRTDRLTSRRQYRTVYDTGRRVRGRFVTVFALPNGLDRCRVGITVTRKLGNAVKRNRIKRALREIFRLHRVSTSGSFDLVVNAHASIADCAVEQIERDFLKCVARLTRGATH